MNEWIDWHLIDRQCMINQSTSSQRTLWRGCPVYVLRSVQSEGQCSILQEPRAPAWSTKKHMKYIELLILNQRTGCTAYREFRVQTPASTNLVLDFCSTSSAPLANLAMMSTLTVYCRWEDETARERTGHPSSYANAERMRLLTLHMLPYRWLEGIHVCIEQFYHRA